MVGLKSKIKQYNAAMSLFIIAVGCGVVFAWTESLIPAIIAHAGMNIPLDEWRRNITAMR